MDCNILLRFVFLFLLSIIIPVARTHADDMAEAIAKAEKAVLAAVAKAEEDPTRPVFHFRPPAQWMNDVCGAFYYQGWHHIFYQFNPYSDQWKPYSDQCGRGSGWGHARSKGLVHWEFLPPVLLPDENNGSVLDGSGSAAFDAEGNPILFFARTPSKGKREQWAALPVDEELIRWRRVDIGLAPGKSGVPADIHSSWADMFVFQADGRTFAVFKASNGLVCEAQNPNLLEWKAVGRLNGILGECPNLFPLDGRYVLILSTLPIRYRIGRFDANKIALNPAKGETSVLDYGPGPDIKANWNRGLYGTTVLQDAQGRSVLLGWVSGFKPKRGWNGCMSLPRILTLDKDNNLIQTVVPELEQLRGKHSKIGKLTLSSESKIIDGVGGDTLEVLARFVAGDAKKFGLRLRPVGGEEGVIELACDGKTLDAAGTKVPDVVDEQQRTLTLHLFFDKSVIELFINDGKKTVTRVVYPGSRDLKVELFSEDGSVTVKSVDAWEIGSIW